MQGVYYYYRKEYNNTEDRLYKSALFLFLNKTCFRGLYRENSKGEFNVPFGNYKNPTFYDKKNIIEINRLINKYNVSFYSEDFEIFLKETQNNDFVYIDSPYVGTFTKYQRGDFKEEEHKRLVETCKKLKMFIQSNSNCDFIQENYKDYKINEVDTIHAVNPKNPGKKVNESLIINV